MKANVSSDWNALARLRWTVVGGVSEGGPHDYFRQVFDRVSSMRSYQVRRLGIWNGGFWFYDPSAREVITVHRADPAEEAKSVSDEADVIRTFPLPYAWRQPPARGVEKLLDEMWYRWRQSDSVQGPWDEAHWPPEYYVDLPAGPAMTNSDPIVSFWANAGCHYCPYGEILFFVLAWRLILRSVQLSGWDADPFDALRADEAEAAQRRLWSPSLWRNVVSRERHWQDFLGSGGGAAEVHEAWRNVSAKTTDDGAPYAWVRDWQTLNLPMRARDARSSIPLKALMAYCRGALAQAPRRPRDTVAVSPGVFRAGLPKEPLALFVGAFQAMFRPSMQSKRFDARFALGAVHRRARFPLLPYFYGLAVDPEPKAHLVIPIWTTIGDIVSVPTRDEAGALNLSRQSSKRATGIVGLATAGVSPITGADPTVEGGTLGGAATRLELIRTFYELLARPAIDVYFYRRRKEEERRAEAAIFRDVHHRLRNLIAELQGPLKAAEDSAKYKEKPVGALLDSLVHDTRAWLETLSRYTDRIELRAGIEPPEDFDFAEFITAFAETIPNDYPIEITVNAIPQAPLTMHGRWNSLWSAFDELAYNARKSASRAERETARLLISTRVAPRRTEQEGELDPRLWLIAELTDNGAGITPQEKARAFEKGYSVSGHTGYGLPRVKRIIEGEFDGYVSIDGTPGTGSTVKVEIPLTASAEEA